MRAPFVYDPNADIEERCQIYLGCHDSAPRYTRGVLAWFHSNSDWMQLAKPADEEILYELTEFFARSDPWTVDPNRADCWQGYWIDRFQRFLPNIEWRKAILTTVPIDSD